MNILVVDDEADARLLFEQRFRQEIREGALSFSFALSGEEALTILRQPGHCPEVVLILSDINLPGMSGLELLRCIRQEYPAAPPQVLMMITAYGNEASYQQALDLGAATVLTNPLDFGALRHLLLPLTNH
ncbi:response regulator transcription factor [Hymenobacter fodinae]|uniref:Response regulator n=1 Tax=Hymenobacter fodinae TaxID=2510796 RepID=A0A4Z0P7I7_9BACT|nr:response regulator [Hymenobacter fodinae]TGE08313.1 response regulator [Hymenobacter fodinae]